MPYHGDIALGATIDWEFTTISQGVPFTLAGSPIISAYPDNSLVQITAGITLNADWDGVTGLNHVRVVASVANGYASGSNYTLVITTGTVNGISVVGYCVGSFSIEARSALRPTTAGRTLAVDSAGLADANMVNAGPTGAGVAQSGGDIFEAVTNIAVTSAALNTTAGSRTITSGTGSGGVANTTALDAVFDNVASSAGAIDFYYEFDLSATTNAVAVGVLWNGYVVGVVNTLKVYGYNWGTASWDQVGSVVGIAGVIVGAQEFDLTTAHIGTGGNLGLVRIRFANTGLTAATVKTDRILLGYAVTPPSANTVRDAILTDATRFAGANIDAAITSRLAPTVAARTLDVSLGGEAGVDWANVGSPTTTVGLTGTTVGTVTTYTGNTPQTGDVYAALTGAQVEPGQAAPAANANVLTKMAYLFKAWRNRTTQTATAYKLFNDDAVTVDQKATFSDDTITADRSEIGSGP